MKKILAPIAVSLIFTASSCNKDKDDDQSNAKNLLLTQKVWAFSNFEEKFGNGPWTAYIEDCDKDNRLAFNSDKTFTYTDGATKCDPGDPLDITGTWELKGSSLVLTVPGESFNYTVEKLNETHLIITLSETVNGMTSYSRETYIHP